MFPFCNEFRVAAEIPWIGRDREMTGFETAGLIERAKAITLRPDETWPRIAAERSSPGEIITRYALPLIAIGPVASFIGGQLFGISMIFATYRPGLMTGLGMAVTAFVMGLVSLIVLALVTDWLAPRFDGQSSRTQAFKLVAYSMTPGWIAGVLGFIPSLGILAMLAAFYGIYLFYKGANPVMKVPGGRAAGFTAVTVIGAILLNWLAALLVTSFTTAVSNSAYSAGNPAGDTVEVTLPGGGTLDTAKMEDAARQLEGLTSGERPKPVDASALQAVLPASAGSFTRDKVQSSGGGGMGALAQATYRKGDREVRVQIMDIAGLGAVAGAIGGLGVEQNREDANGYERIRTVNGVIQTEKWDKRTSTGTFGVQVANRFMVQAEGDADSIDDLKALVGAVDQARLAALAR